jgi:hypothetical protein
MATTGTYTPSSSSSSLTLHSSSLPSSDAQFKSQFNNLVWADEFNNGISGDWTYDIGGGGWGNNELEYYRSENAWTDGGNLVIVAKRESYGGLVLLLVDC